MDESGSLLTWNTSARDPLIMALLLIAIAGLTLLLSTRPRLYLPLMLFTAPLPKLFTVTQYEAWGNRQNASGFSVVDLVLGAGLAATLLRPLRSPQLPQEAALERSMWLWSGSVLLSVGIGLVLWPGIYEPGNALYAFRHILTLASYALAVRYAMEDATERSMRTLLRRMTVAGNVTIALGVLYYFYFGSAQAGSASTTLYSADQTIFRSYLFFFDYGGDMGYYAVTIAILNLIVLADRRTFFLKLTGFIGTGLCVLAVLLLGERVNLLVLVVALGYFFLETSRHGHRSVRVSVAFQVTCLLAVCLAGAAVMRVVAPQQISEKIENTNGSNFGDEGSAVMAEAGVPSAIIETVASLPIGDFGVRLGLTLASLWFFVQHPLGVGFWGEYSVTGWYAHHEVIKILVEQGLPGIVAFIVLIASLRRLLWSHTNLPGAGGQLGVLMRSVSFALFMALLMANTVLLNMKYAYVYWTLLGVWSAIPRTNAMTQEQVQVSQRVLVTA